MITEVKHTPWQVDVEQPDPNITYDSGAVRILDSDGSTVVELDGWQEDVARRIVAAVNAVEGIPTEALESGIVQHMIAELKGAESLLSGRLSGAQGRHRIAADAILMLLAELEGND